MIITVTGHRPQSCPCKFDKQHPWLKQLRKDISDRLSRKKGSIEYVTCGMAIGFDTWFALECIRLNIPIRAYIPFDGQEKKWGLEDQHIYHQILKYAEKQYCFYSEYNSNAFKERDYQMVRDGTIVVALLNPKAEKSGTAMTVRYAEQLGRTIVNMWRD